MSNSENHIWDLIGKLAEEATGMTGNQIVDNVRIQRGRGYIEDFKLAYPESITFINTLMNSPIYMVIITLSLYRPELARLRHINQFLTALQKALK